MLFKRPYHFPSVGLRNVKTGSRLATRSAPWYYFWTAVRLCLHRGHFLGKAAIMAPANSTAAATGFSARWWAAFHRHGPVCHLRRHLPGTAATAIPDPDLAGVVVLILACQLIWVGGVQPGAVLCIILFNTPDRQLCLLCPQPHSLILAWAWWAALFVNGCCPAASPSIHAPLLHSRMGIRDDV